MKFSEAYQIMLKGGRVRRAGWTGFWYINSVTGELVIRKANGEELVNDTDNLRLTVDNTLAEDWQEAKW